MHGLIIHDISRDILTSKIYRDQLAGQPEGIPCGDITDKPRYPWRGLMVDPARHFLPTADLKKFVDMMAYYKFNKMCIRDRPYMAERTIFSPIRWRMPA